ncbi:Annexin A6 [Clydaea vesicula]|uniref:Annexin A6 n=1 Tax=Clydaea vesicula TaxID=447962 RepID=A0AAD5XZ64_9FUNG|nr:Annexin A6 [Clydaea vesicula]
MIMSQNPVESHFENYYSKRIGGEEEFQQQFTNTVEKKLSCCSLNTVFSSEEFAVQPVLQPLNNTSLLQTNYEYQPATVIIQTASTDIQALPEEAIILNEPITVSNVNTNTCSFEDGYISVPVIPNEQLNTQPPPYSPELAGSPSTQSVLFTNNPTAGCPSSLVYTSSSSFTDASHCQPSMVCSSNEFIENVEINPNVLLSTLQTNNGVIEDPIINVSNSNTLTPINTFSAVNSNHNLTSELQIVSLEAPSYPESTHKFIGEDIPTYESSVAGNYDKHHHNNNFESDMEDLLRCFKGIAANEYTLIKIIGKRPISHLNLLNEKFQGKNGESLLLCIKQTTDHDMFEVCKAYLCDPYDYDSSCIKDSLRGMIGVDLESLFEILSGRTNLEMEQICTFYKKKTNCCLRKAISSKVSAKLAKFFDILLTTKRKEEEIITPEKVEFLTISLQNYVKEKKLTKILTVFCTNSVKVLQLTLQNYKIKEKRNFKDSFKKKFTVFNSLGDFEKGILYLVSSLEDLHLFFAEEINNSLDGIGAKEFKLIRLLVRITKLGKLEDIKHLYKIKFGRSIADKISRELKKNNFQKMLLACLDRDT